MRLIRWFYQLLTRVMSLRIIVVVAALAVVALVITLGAWVWIGVTNDQYSQLDRRLDSVSSLGDISTLLRTPQTLGLDEPSQDGGLVRTARVDGSTVSVPQDSSCRHSTMDTPARRSTGWSTGFAPLRPATRRSRSAPRWPRRSAGSTSCTGECC